MTSLLSSTTILVKQALALSGLLAPHSREGLQAAVQKGKMALLELTGDTESNGKINEVWQQLQTSLQEILSSIKPDSRSSLLEKDLSLSTFDEIHHLVIKIQRLSSSSFKETTPTIAIESCSRLIHHYKLMTQGSIGLKRELIRCENRLEKEFPR